jgi:hypothetical protein
LQIAVAETEKNAEKALAWMEGNTILLYKQEVGFLFYLCSQSFASTQQPGKGRCRSVCGDQNKFHCYT